MSRYYGTGVNGRGNTHSFGGRVSAGEMHLRGWDSGVRVVPVDDKSKPDEFQVYMTTGSHGAGSDKLIGHVRTTPDGPVFFPVDAITGLTTAPAWVGYDCNGE